MKEVICDICKRTQIDLAKKGIYIRHFKMSLWNWWSFDRTGERNFDICDCCLKKIAEQMKGEKE